jgi:hypothetical protein
MIYTPLGYPLGWTISNLTPERFETHLHRRTMFPAKHSHTLFLLGFFLTILGETPEIMPGLVFNTLLYQITTAHHARTLYNPSHQPLIPAQSSGIYSNPPHLFGCIVVLLRSIPRRILCATMFFPFCLALLLLLLFR